MTKKNNPIKFSFIIALIFSVFFSANVQASVVEGVVFSRQGSVAKSHVVAYPDYKSLSQDKNGIKSSPGEKPGQFHLELKPGRYYFIARGEAEKQDLYAYHGLNPVTISKDYYWLPMFSVPSTPPQCQSGPQGIAGKVIYNDDALAGGVISLYELQGNQFRGMGLLTNTLDEEGRFWFDVEPGDYVLIARKRHTGQGIGPVQKQDLFCYPAANPIKVTTGNYCEVAIACYPRDNLQEFLDLSAANPQGKKITNRRPASLWDVTGQEAEASAQQSAAHMKATSISGQVVNLAGKPVGDIYVSAYPAQGLDLFQMHVVRMKTNFMAKTDNNGFYKINLDQSGRFYLVARDKVGGAPDRLEHYGLYEGNPNHSITLTQGDKRDNINIMVERIMPYSSLARDFY